MRGDAKTEIVNGALMQLGSEPVPDLSEASLQNSIAATKLMRVIELARDTALRRHGWLCALTYAELPCAVIAGYENWKFPGHYLLPGNYLRMWEVQGQRCGLDGIDVFGLDGSGVGVGFAQRSTGNPTRWQTGTMDTTQGARTILLGDRHSMLKVAFVRRASWAAMDAHVRDQVSYDLAARGAYSVTGDQALQAKLEKNAEAKAMMAISVDGTQEEGQAPLGPSVPAALRAYSRY